MIHDLPAIVWTGSLSCQVQERFSRRAANSLRIRKAGSEQASCGCDKLRLALSGELLVSGTVYSSVSETVYATSTLGES
jgi:hypothetical protein